MRKDSASSVAPAIGCASDLEVVSSRQVRERVLGRKCVLVAGVSVDRFVHVRVADMGGKVQR